MARRTPVALVPVGLTVQPDGQQYVWLDDPASEHRWWLPDAATVSAIIASQRASG